MLSMKNFLFTILFFSHFLLAQDSLFVRGTIFSSRDKVAIANATVVNKTTLKTTTSNAQGKFVLEAKVNDEVTIASPIYFTEQIKITADFLNTNRDFYLQEKGTEIETIYITSYKLTGYLEIDTKKIPVNENFRYNIPGLKAGYESGKKSKNALVNRIEALSNPVDLVYNMFNKKEKELKKLFDLKNDANFKNILSVNTNRESLSLVLNLSKIEIDAILNKCNYSQVFIDTASDLQVLDALTLSYSEYKALKK
jgi:hypothetical protein